MSTCIEAFEGLSEEGARLAGRFDLDLSPQYSLQITKGNMTLWHQETSWSGVLSLSSAVLPGLWFTSMFPLKSDCCTFSGHNLFYRWGEGSYY